MEFRVAVQSVWLPLAAGILFHHSKSVRPTHARRLDYTRSAIINAMLRTSWLFYNWNIWPWARESSDRISIERYGPLLKYVLRDSRPWLRCMNWCTGWKIKIYFLSAQSAGVVQDELVIEWIPPKTRRLPSGWKRFTWMRGSQSKTNLEFSPQRNIISPPQDSRASDISTSIFYSAYVIQNQVKCYYIRSALFKPPPVFWTVWRQL